MQQHIADFMELIIGDRNPVTAPQQHAKVPNLVAERWSNWGLKAQIHTFKHHAFYGQNVWVEPHDPTKPFALLIAHHDTVPNCPGADDNGSGMAVLDAVAHWLATDNSKLNLALCLTDFEEGDPRIWTIDLPATDSKEPPNKEGFWSKASEKYSDPTQFLGSRELLRFLNAQNLLSNLEVLLNFETVGYRSEKQEFPKKIPKKLSRKVNQGDFVGVVGNKKAKKWIHRIKQVASEPESVPALCFTVPGKGMLVLDTRRSDHAPFWDAKLPAIMLTDTANFRNPNYHLPTDTEIDTEFIAQITQLAISVLIAE